jgi:hypothetical protein
MTADIRQDQSEICFQEFSDIQPFRVVERVGMQADQGRAFSNDLKE